MPEMRILAAQSGTLMILSAKENEASMGWGVNYAIVYSSDALIFVPHGYFMGKVPRKTSSQMPIMRNNVSHDQLPYIFSFFVVFLLSKIGVQAAQILISVNIWTILRDYQKNGHFWLVSLSALNSAAHKKNMCCPLKQS